MPDQPHHTADLGHHEAAGTPPEPDERPDVPAATVKATTPGRSSAVTRRVLVLAMVLAVPAIAWSLLPSIDWTSQTAGPMVHRVQRKGFIHEITERGTVQSASNVEIRCEVESRNSSGTQILYIVPEGTYVTPVPDWEPENPDDPEEPPDLLVRLDSSALESELTQKQIVCANSEAVVIQSQNVLDTARIAENEYINGKYVETKQASEADIAVAKENDTRAGEYYEYSKLLHSKGYIAGKELNAAAFDVQKRKLELAKAETALKVLEDYTKPRMLLELDANIKSAEAKFKAAQHSYQLDLEELALVETQLAHCTIRAPESGEVVYANITDRRGGSEIIIEEGTTVRERQVIIRLPDPKRMQVQANVNEAKVALVKPGMAVTIRLDAFADLKLEGEVERVNKYTAPSSFFTGNVKEFETIIAIKNDNETETEAENANGEETLSQLRSGMTAEVKIRVEEIPDVLQVPVQAVVEHGGRHYCVVRDGSGFRAKQVTIGSTNDKVVVIHEGIDEGEEVVLNAAAYRREANLPEPLEEPVAARVRSDGSPASQQEADSERSAQPTASQRVEEMLERMDSNGNGQLELDELPEGMRSVMSEADTNGDGVIDRQELAAGIARMPAGGRSGGRGQGGGGMGGRGVGAGRQGGRGPGPGGPGARP